MKSKAVHKLLLKQLDELQNDFPRLNLVGLANPWTIQGTIDICDSLGNYWNTFDIVVIVPPQYPFGVPILLERSTLLPRSGHVGADGVCCVAMSMELSLRARSSFSLLDYLKEFVRPFLQGQLFFLATGDYAGGEHRHDFAGRLDWYMEKLGSTIPDTVLNILEQVECSVLPGRNEPCCCGSGYKYKRCHYDSIRLLSGIPKQDLLRDIELLRNAIDSNTLEEVLLLAARQE